MSVAGLPCLIKQCDVHSRNATQCNLHRRFYSPKNTHVTTSPTFQSLLYFPLPLQNRLFSVFNGLSVQVLPSQSRFSPQLQDRRNGRGILTSTLVRASSNSIYEQTSTRTRHFLRTRAIGKSPFLGKFLGHAHAVERCTPHNVIPHRADE